MSRISESGVNAGLAAKVAIRFAFFLLLVGCEFYKSAVDENYRPGIRLALEASSVVVDDAIVRALESTTVRLMVRDQAGYPYADDGLDVEFFLTTGDSSGTFSKAQYQGQGVYTSTFVAQAAGSATYVGARVNGAVLTSTFPPLTVIAGQYSLVESEVEVSATQVASGAEATIFLNVRDEQGNPFLASGLNVVFGSLGGSSTGTFTAASYAGNGRYSATFTGVIAGSVTNIVATINGQNVTSSSPDIRVVPGNSSRAQSVLQTDDAIIAAGDSTLVTLTLKDASGNRITSGGQSVSFSRSGGTSAGTFGAVTDHGDGTYSSVFTGVVAGTDTTIRAQIDGEQVTSTLPLLRVVPGAVSLAHSLVSASVATVSSGNQAVLLLRVKDAQGNQLSSGGLTVSFAHVGGGSSGTLGAVTDHDDGTYSATFTGVLAGTATRIEAYIGAAKVQTASPEIAVVPGLHSLATSTLMLSHASIASGAAATATLVVRDAAGNRLTSGGLAINFSHTGGTSAGAFSAVSDSLDGGYSAVFTGTTAGTATTIRAAIGGDYITSALPTIAVTPGAVSMATSELAVSGSSVTSGASLTSTFTAKDAAGNIVTGANEVVVFAHTGGTSAGTFGVVTNHNDGTYSALFTGTTAGSATTITATYHGVNLTSTLPQVVVNPGAPDAANSSVSVSGSSVPSGDSINVSAIVRDASNNLITSGVTVAFSHAGGTSTGTFGSVTDLGSGTHASVFTGVAAGTATSISATLNGVPVTSALPTVQVIAGDISLANSTVTVASGSVNSGDTVTVTVTARDINNNLKHAGINVQVSHGGGSSTGNFSAVTNVGDGTYTALFTGVVAGTPTTINASIDSGGITSTLPTIAVDPGALSLAQSSVSLSASNVASGNSVVATLVTRDAAGNALTSDGLTVVFTTSANPVATVGSTTDHHNGSYSATVNGLVAGSASIGAKIGGSDITSVLPVLVVGAGGSSAAESVVTLSAASVASGSSVLATLIVKDANGNHAGTGGQTVHFSHVGGTSTGTWSAVTDHGDGTYTASFTGVLAGTSTTVATTLDGQSITSTAPTVAVVPGPLSLAQSGVSVSAASVSSGSSVVVTMTARDAAGNALATGGSTIVFSHTGGTSAGTLGAVTDHGDGTYTANFTGTTAGTATTLAGTINAQSALGAASVTVTPGAISLMQSTIVIADSSLASGHSTVATVTLKDAAGNLVTTGETIAISAQGGASTVIVGGVTNHNDGTYTASLTGDVAGAATSIRATVNGSPLTSAFPSLTVTPGSLSLAHSTLQVAQATVVSGASVTVTFTARDSANNALTSGGISNLSFSYSGGTSTGTFAAITDHGNGTYSAGFAGTLSGTAITLQASVGGSPITTVLPTLTVLPGAFSLAESLLGVSSASVDSGSDVTVTLVVKDAAGNLVGAGGATVAFTHSGGTSSGTFSSVTDELDGTYTASFTGLAAGTATTIRATLNGSHITSTLPTITVNAGSVSLSQSLVTVSATSVASASPVVVTLVAKDAQGNQLPAGALSVAFSHTGGSSAGTFGSVTDHGDGTYTANFTGTTAGSATSIRASVGGSFVTSALPTVTVEPGPVSLSQTAVQVSASTIAAGSTSTVTVAVRDGHGNLRSAGGDVVTITHSGGTSTGTIGAVTDHSDGTYSAVFTGVAAGTATTILAMVAGDPVTSSLPEITVSAGTLSLSQSTVTLSAATVASGSDVIATLTARDAAGNLIGTGGETVTFAKSGGTSTISFSATSDQGDGTYVATLTGAHAGTATNIIGSVDGNALLSAPPQLVVTAGASSAAQSIVSVSAASVNAGATITVTLTVKDAAGNAVASGGQAVEFSHAGGTSTGTFSAVVDNNDGTYSAIFTGKISGTPTTIHADLDSAAVSSTLPTVTVNPGAFSLAQSSVTVASSSISSGAGTLVTLVTRDSEGNLLASGGSTIAFEHTGGGSTGVFSSVNDLGNGSYTSTFTGVLAGTATTIRGSVNGDWLSSVFPSVTVGAGAISSAHSTVSVAQSSVASGSGITVTLQAYDANGNALSAGGETVLFSHSGGTSTGNLSAITDQTDGTYTAQFAGVVAGTATTIQATINGTPVTTTLPTITVVPGAATHLAFVDQPGGGDAGAAWSTQPKVEILDANNNRVSSATDLVTLSIHTNPSGGTLAGTNAVNAVAGLATYSGLSINLSGTGYKLAAAAGSLTAAESATFDIASSAADSIEFSVQPTNVVAGAVWNPQPVVRVLDDQGALITSGVDSTANITLTLFSGTGSLLGTASMAAVGGVADFSGKNLAINVVGSKILRATKADTSGSGGAGALIVDSDSFAVQAGDASPSTSTIVGSPSLVDADGVSQSTVTIRLRDAYSNAIAGTSAQFASTGSNNTLTQPVALTNASGQTTGAIKSTMAEPKTLSISLPNGLTSVTNTVSFASGTPDQDTSTISATNNVVANGVNVSTITITLKDESNNAVAGVVPTYSVTGTGNTLGVCSTSNGSGVSTCALTSTKAQAKTISVLTPVNISANTTFVAGAAAKLAFVTQPAGAATAQVFGTQPVVEIQDANGNKVNSAVAVAIAIEDNPGGGTLSGTLSRNAVTGTATFTNLAINNQGTGYTLKASSGVLTPAISNAFQVTVVPTQLTFEQQPTTVASGADFSPDITVMVRDGGGAHVPGSSVAVTLAIDTNPASGTLSGTLTVNAENGIATFSGISLDKAGVGYKLKATSSGLTQAVSSSFAVTYGAPAKLAVTAVAAAGVAGTELGTQPVIEIQDAAGNLIANSSATVSMEIYKDAACTLPGTGSLNIAQNPITAVNGVASFGGVSYTAAGTFYVGATSPGLTRGCSSAIAIAPGDAVGLTITGPAISNSGGGCSAAYSVNRVDSYGNIKSGTSVPAVALASTGATGFFSNATCATAITTVQVASASGQVAFYTKTASPENVTLTATKAGLNTGSLAVAYKSISASFQIGQNDFTSILGFAKGYSGPSGLATDGSKLVVVDGAHDRALVYNSIPTSSQPQADVAISAATLYRAGSGSTSQSTLRSDPQRAVIAGGKLIIADTTAHRVLIWNSIPTAHLANADVVLGQTTFTAQNKNQTNTDTVIENGFNSPRGVASDGTRLVVADTLNNRVLVWNAIPTSHAEAPNLVLGQSDFTTGDINAGGTPSAQTFYAPSGIFVYGSGVNAKLFVSDASNNRLLIWNTFPTSNQQAADVVLGQADFTSGVNGPTVARLRTPRDVYYNGNQLFVVDSGANRVAVWNSIETSGANIDYLLGQTSFTSTTANNGGLSAVTLSTPMAITGHGDTIYVADQVNNRVLVWETPITEHRQPATRILGQAAMNRSNVQDGGLGGGVLNAPQAVCYDGSKFYLSESRNNRVLVFDSVPTADGAQPEYVLGQPDMNSNQANNGGSVASLATLATPYGLDCNEDYLAVVDSANNRVLIWNLPISANQQPANVVVGQASESGKAAALSSTRMAGPRGVALAGDRLVVIDGTNHRVLLYDEIPTAHGAEASYVLGQTTFTTKTTGATLSTLNTPRGVSWDGTRLFISDSTRILVWDGIPAENGSAASYSITATVVGVYSNGTSLFGPTATNRVLVWNNIPAASATHDRVLGQATTNTSTSAGTTEVLMSTAGAAQNTIRIINNVLFVPDFLNQRIMAIPWD